LGDELAVSEKSQDLVAEDELGLTGVDIGDRLPRPVVEENPASDDGMNVRIPIEGGTEGLDHRHMPGRAMGSSEAAAILSRTVS
jgi:hypothetical protein